LFNYSKALEEIK